MPVNDPFGPSVYVPDLNTGAAGASQGWATGLSNLGKALFPDPSTLADARYKAAQTGALNTAAGARSQLQNILGGDPNVMADPSTRQKAFGLIQLLPAEEQNATRANMSAWIQNSNLDQPTKDSFQTALGVQPYPSTQTGQNAALQNQINVAHIGAGPGYAQAAATVESAKIHSAADIAVEQQRSETTLEKDDRELVPIITPTGVTSVTKKEAREGGYTLLQPNATPESTATTIVTHEQPGQRPLKEAPSSQGVSPPPEATQPQGVSPGTAATTAITKVQGTNVPKEDPLITLQRIANADLQTGYWASTSDPKINPQGHYNIGPRAAQAVVSRATQIANDRTQREYNNQPAAMVRAYNEIISPIKNDPSALVYSSGYSPLPFTKNDPPSVDFAPNYVPPPPPPLNPTYTPQPPPPPPAATPLAPSNRRAVPVPTVPLVPPPPATTKAPVPEKKTTQPPGPTPAPAQGAQDVGGLRDIPQEKRVPGMIYQGQVLLDPANPAKQESWRPAKQADINKARQNGMLYK
jgi:hypothetical protein